MSELDPVWERHAREIASRVGELLRDGPPIVVQEYLTPEQAARLLGMPIRTLENYRVRDAGGPPFHRISSRLIRYRVSELHEWMEARRVECE
ncbi:MAG: DNA-binding protein [Alphaproteobacteria bacterium]|nr:MAG: DNA-binding protein [Alphaproteobacteria bacterium]